MSSYIGYAKTRSLLPPVLACSTASNLYQVDNLLPLSLLSTAKKGNEFRKAPLLGVVLSEFPDAPYLPEN